MLTIRHRQTWLCSSLPGARRKTLPPAREQRSLLSWSPSDSPAGLLRGEDVLINFTNTIKSSLNANFSKSCHNLRIYALRLALQSRGSCKHIYTVLLMRLSPAGEIVPRVKRPGSPKVPSRSIILCMADPLWWIRGESVAVDMAGAERNQIASQRSVNSMT